MFKHSWFGNTPRNTRAKTNSHAAPPKRTVLSIETLEDRDVPASIDFANLRFDYDGKLPAPVNGQYQIRTPVTVQLPSQDTLPVRNLMRFDGGVNLPVDASKTDVFSSVGDVWSLAGGGKALSLFDGGSSDTRLFDSSDLLGATNSKLGSKFQDTNGVGIKKITAIGHDFTFSTLRVDDTQSKSPALLAKGSFNVGFGMLGNWDIPLPDGNDKVNPYIRIHNGSAGFGTDLSFPLPGKTFTRNNWTITLGKTDAFPTQNPVTFSYSTSAANRINISGDIRLQNDKIFDNKNGVLASLGSSTEAGLQFTNGRFTRFDMTLATESAFSIKGLNFTPQTVNVVYKEVENKAAPVGGTITTNQVFEISGAASITKEGKGFFAGMKSIGIFLGTQETKTTKATPGIVITDGSLTSLTAGLTIDRINFGTKVSLTDLQLGLAYVPEKSYYGITGGANLNLTGLTDTDTGAVKFAVSLGSVQDAQPGIIIENGSLKRFDMGVTTAAEFQIKKLTINPRAFRFAYEEAPDGSQTFYGYGSIGLRFTLANKPTTIDVTLGDSSGDANGFVVKNGVLDSFQAEVSASFRLFGTQVDAQSLKFQYVRDTSPTTPGDQSQFVINGAAGLSNGQSFNLQTNFGTPNRNGLVIEEGAIRDLFITTSGSFNLRGLNVTADGLTIGFNRDTQTVFMSGGVQVRLGSTISFGASITGAGLTFNTDTGQFQIATVDSATPLEIKGNFAIAGFVAVDASFKYQQTAAGVVVAGSGSVNVAGKFGATAAFTIVNGDLTSIALSVRTRITLGATGMSITEMNGSVTNLNDIPRLEISGGVKLEHEAKLGSTTLLSVEGTFTIKRDRLNLSGSVNFLNGFATGKGSVDLNWTLGVYKIDASLSIYKDAIQFNGSLQFDNLGNINVFATASLSFPNDWPFIGGYQIATGGFAMQIRPGGKDEESYVAGWGAILNDWIKVGFRYHINTQKLTFDTTPPALAPLPPVKPPQETVYEYTLQMTTRTEKNDPSKKVFNIDDLVVNRFGDQFFPRTEPIYLNLTGSGFSDPNKLWLNDSIKIPNQPYYDKQSSSYKYQEKIWQIKNLSWQYKDPQDLIKGIIIRVPNLDRDGKIIYRSTILQNNVNGTFVYNYKRPIFSRDGNFGTYSVGIDGMTLQSSFQWLSKNEFGGTPSLSVAIYAIPQNNNNDGTPLLIERAYIDDVKLRWDPVQFSTLNLRYNWRGLFTDKFPDQTYKIFYAVEEDGKVVAVSDKDADADRPVAWTLSRLDHRPIINAPKVVGLDGTGSKPFTVLVTQPQETNSMRTFTAEITLSSNNGGSIRLGDGTTVGQTALIRSGLTRPQLNALLKDIVFSTANAGPTSASMTLKVTQATDFDGISFSSSENIPLANPNVNLSVKSTGTSNSPSPMFPRIGDEVTMTVSLSNPAGPNVVEATNIEIKAALPTSLQFVSALVPANRGSYLPNSGIWRINNLGVGETLTLTVVARVQQGVSPGDTLLLTTQATNAQSQFNPSSRFDSVRFTIGSGNPVRLAGRSLADGGLGAPYFQMAPAFESGATGAGWPYTYFVRSGSLPSGLALDPATGAIHGTPRTPGSFTFQIDAADRIGNSAQSNGQSAKTYTILVPEFNLNVGSPSRIDDNADPFSIYWRFSIGSGALPPGMRLGSSGADNGAIVGTPTAPGTYRFQIRRSDWLGVFSTSRDYVVRISTAAGRIVQSNNQPLDSLRLTTGRALAGSTAIQVFAANNANPPTRITTPVTFAAVNLPPGLSLSPTGLLTGTPVTSGGQSPSTIYAFDASGIRSVASVSFFIAQGAFATTGTLPQATTGQSYSQTLPISGGFLGRNVFQAVSLPAGLSLSSDGVLSGIPTVVAGTQPYTVSFRVGVGGGTGTPFTLPLTVLAAPRITNAEMSYGLLNAPFSQQFTSTGGTGRGYTWSWSGNLPVGLTLNPSTGLLSGKPEFQGRYPVNISVTDSAGAKTTQTFTFVVANAAIPANASSKFVLQSGTTGLAVNSGNIEGMQLSAQGELSGTPVRRAIQILSSRETRSGNWFIRQYRVAVGFPAAGNIETNQGEMADLKILPIQSPFVGYTYKLLSPTSFTQPANGTVAFNSTTSSFRFTPRGDFFGTDSFTYTLVNSVGIESIATVSVNVKSLLVVPRGNIPAPAGQATPLNNNRAVQLVPQSWGQGQIQVTLTLARGTLALPPSQEVRATARGTTTTLTGPIDAVNTVLQGLTYTPASGFSGNMNLTVRAEQPRTNGTPLSVGASVTLTTSGRTLHAINAGGTATGSFNADANFTGGTAASISNSIGITTTGITDPAPLDAYRSERWGEFTYTLGNLQAGRSYTVRLDFVEIDPTKTRAGLRVFDVAINGTKVLSNFDIFAAAGAQYRLVRREFTATANSSGQIVIAFTQGTAKLDYPKISTISVIE